MSVLFHIKKLFDSLVFCVDCNKLAIEGILPYCIFPFVIFSALLQIVAV